MQSDVSPLLVLEEDECLRRLGPAGIGRVGVTVGALPAIFPVNYAVHDRAVYFRAAPGTKLVAASANAIVAFEVDEVDRISHAGWSVLVVGHSSVVTDPVELAVVARLPLAQWVPDQDQALVRIDAELVSGRELNPMAATVPA